MRERLGDRLPDFSQKDKELLRMSIDFVGLNHYTTRFVAHATANRIGHAFYRVQEAERIAEWEGGEVIGEKAASPWLFIVPWGIRKILNYIAQRYNNPPIYVTENGMDDEDKGSSSISEMLDDKKRVSYFKGYLAAVAQAIKWVISLRTILLRVHVSYVLISVGVEGDGTDVRGYFAWSLMDNFEWQLGYTKRFGLIYVDYNNGLSRHLKSSAYWFLRLLREEGKCGKDD
ncbi:unnamed protein product [Ilex paraguariensis]|uniref:Beta-glucosidase n=1 Tax=Ilex paraguariensis TaxID=185542 RepID=A0ABC8SZ65_9AQUA